MNVLGKIFFLLFVVIALASGLSEPLCRNSIRIIFFITVVLAFTDQRVLDLAIKYKRLPILMFAFTGWLIVSAFHSGHVPDSSDSSVYWIYFSHNMLLFIPIALFIKSERQINRLLIVLAISLLLNDIVVDLQIYYGSERPVTFLRGAFMQSALLYTILLPIYLILALRAERTYVKVLCRLFFIFSLGAFILLNTRGAWFAMLIVLSAAFVFCIRSWKKIFSIGLIFAIVAGIFVTVLPQINSRFETLKNVSTEQSVTERVLIWRSAIAMIEDNPILGVGFGNFEQKYQREYILPEAKERWQSHAHNVYLQFWAENGVIGLASFCALFGYILQQSWRHRQNKYAAMIFFSTLGFLLYSLTDYTYSSYAAMRVYWFVFAICLRGVDFSVDKL